MIAISHKKDWNAHANDVPTTFGAQSDIVRELPRLGDAV